MRVNLRLVQAVRTCAGEGKLRARRNALRGVAAEVLLLWVAREASTLE